MAWNPFPLLSYPPLSSPLFFFSCLFFLGTSFPFLKSPLSSPPLSPPSHTVCVSLSLSPSLSWLRFHGDRDSQAGGKFSRASISGGFSSSGRLMGSQEPKEPQLERNSSFLENANSCVGKLVILIYITNTHACKITFQCFAWLHHMIGAQKQKGHITSPVIKSQVIVVTLETKL